MPKTTQSNEFGQQALASANFAARINDDRNVGGEIQYASIVVPFDGTAMAIGDVVFLLKLPAGAFVLPELSQILVITDITSGSVMVHVGDILNANRYGINIDVSDRGVKPFIAAAATVFPAGAVTRLKVDDTGVPATDTSLVTMTINGATTAAGLLTVLLAFKTL